jgi:hypothetical protein
MHANDLSSLASLHVLYTPTMQPKLYEDHLRKKSTYYYSSPAAEVDAAAAAAAAVGAASRNLKFHA